MATPDNQNFPQTRDANAIITHTRDGRLEGVPAEELHAWRGVMARHQASLPHEVQFKHALARIGDELDSRAQDKRHKEALETSEKLHENQIFQLRRLNDESSEQGKTQHHETQRLARKAYYAAVAGVIIALIALIFEIVKSFLTSAHQP